jgi:HlyD family secretion protein
MKSLISKLLRRKFLIGTIVVVLIIGGYYGYKAIFGDQMVTSYATAAVEKGTLTVSVSGSGQVSAENQVDVKSKVSGDVVWLGIKAGQKVASGQALLSLDDTDAKKAVADAELAIEEAELNLDKSSAEVPITYQNKLDSLETAEDNLKKEYENLFSAVSNAFLSLPALVTNNYNILYGTDLTANSVNQFNVDVYRNLFSESVDHDLVNSMADIAVRDYKTAREAYDNNFLQFKKLTLYSSESEKEKMLDGTLDTTRAVGQSIKSGINLMDTIVDIAKNRSKTLNPTITTFQTNLRTYLTTANNSLSSLLSEQGTLKTAKTTITNTKNDISLLEINNPTGLNPIDLQISKNDIEQKKVALEVLKSDLAKYTIYSPFSGVITSVDIKRGDSISSGTTLANIITNEKIAEISLNEVDVAQVEIGQKVTLTFDAVEDLTITGEVAEIDTVGTVSQGVVSYNVKIVFDTKNEKVKLGMSVSASIITDIRQDVLLVPNAAVKSNNEQYVEVLEGDVPVEKPVVVGLSNDTLTEIISGLNEGDKVITQTKTGTASTQAVSGTSKTNQNSAIRIPGIGGASPVGR